MVQRFGKPPATGSTDWAAKKILRLLDREELENAESLRLRKAGWTPTSGQPAATSDHGQRFGDGRDAIADLVQADLDHRQALRDEAQRRVGLQLAKVRQDMLPIPPQKPEDLGGASGLSPLPPQKPIGPDQTAVEGLPYAPMGPGRNVTEADRQAFRNALESRGGLTPTMRSIMDYLFDFEGGYKPDKSEPSDAPDRYPVTGIRQDTLRAYQDAFYKENPEVRSAMGSRFFKPGELNDQQRISIMKWIADTRMGKLDINEIAAPSTEGAIGDPKLAGLLFDQDYRWGTMGITPAVQNAITETLRGYRQDLIAAGTNPDDLGVPDRVKPDGIPGSETREAIMLLLNAGRSDALRAAISAEIRKTKGNPKGDAKAKLSPNDEYRLSVFE